MDAMEEDFKIPMTETVNREVIEMCNWSKGVKEAAMEKGLQQGMQQGRAEGRVEGQLANMLKVFLKLIAKMVSFEEAADTVGAETQKKIEYLRQHMPA